MKVIVYSKEDCIQCTFTKRRLHSSGVPYTAIDVEKATPAVQEYVKGLGHTNLPIVVLQADGKPDVTWSGFQPSRLRDINHRDVEA